MSQILGPDDIEDGIAALARAIREHTGDRPIGLIGIRSRGDEVAERVCRHLSEDDRELALGTLDISLYRDDFEHLHDNPKLQESDIPFDIDGRHLILIDDVLFTGRTIRAALAAIMDYGRPERVELGVLIDRGHREMPIQPDYVGIRLDTARRDHVYVSLESTDGKDEVEIRPAP